MREIKFRAWNKDWKMMVLPEDLQAIWFDGVTACAADVEFNITTTDGQRNKNLWEDCEKDEVTLMQYTGLKDKKGVEIYIGDIIIDNNVFIETVDVGIGQVPVAELPDGRIWEVTMRDFEDGIVLLNNEKEMGCCDHVEGEFSITECEVIGNIYQNPELLK